MAEPSSYTTRTEPLRVGERSSPWREAGVLLLVLLGCVVPMLAGLGHRDTTHTMENLAVFSSQETWLRLHGWHELPAEADAWLMPSRNGEPRLRKPPGVVWANLVAWTGLTPGEANATPADLLYRARLVSVVMGLLLIAGVYGVGRQLGDRSTAVLAALVAGTMILTQKQARYASYDIYMSAWLTVAMAAAPLRGMFVDAATTRGRAVARWALAGVCVGVAWMCKGPLAPAVFVVAIAGVAFAAGGRGWKRVALGLPTAAVAAGVVALPWYAYAYANYPLLEAMPAEAAHVQQRPSPPWFYAGLIGLVFPWSVWLIGGLFLPWLRLGGARRRQALAAWAWFVAILVMFTIPAAKQQRYILPIVPAAALLIAQLWRWHQELADAGEEDPGGGFLRWPHAVMLIGWGLLFVPFALLQERLVAWGLIEEPELGGVSPTIAILGVGMLINAGLVAAWTLRRNKRPHAAAFVTAGWMVVFSAGWWWAYGLAPDGVHPVRADAEIVAVSLEDDPVRSFITPDLDESINEELLFYSQRVMPEVDAEGLAAFAAVLDHADRAGYVVAPVGEPRDAALRSLGAIFMYEFQEDYDRRAGLWRIGLETRHPRRPAD